MWMRAPSSVSRVRRTSSSRTPSPLRSVQSPPPANTFPRSRAPSNWPLAIGAVTRVPRGTAPILCTPATATCSLINERESTRHHPSLGFAVIHVDTCKGIDLKDSGPCCNDASCHRQSSVTTHSLRSGRCPWLTANNATAHDLLLPDLRKEGVDASLRDPWLGSRPARAHVGRPSQPHHWPPCRTGQIDVQCDRR